MTTLQPALKIEHKRPGLIFWLLWMAAGYAGGITYAIPVSVVHILLGLNRLADPPRPGDLSGWMWVLAAVLSGAACGSTIGLAQWLVLRRERGHMGGWVATTILGYGSIGLLPLVASIFQPGWPYWAFTLIITGKLHWLARLVPSWPAASWPAGVITLTLFGAVLGAAQWLILRGRVRGAAWWIAISTLGWALGAALSNVPSAFWAVTASWDVPMAIAGAGLVWLLRQSAPAVSAAA